MSYHRLPITILLLAALFWKVFPFEKRYTVTRLMAACKRNKGFEIFNNSYVKKCLQYVLPMKYAKAKEYCQARGGMVATFKNKMEQQIAADFFKGRPDYEHPLLYIGLDRLDDLKTFKWIDNEEPYPEYIEKPIPTNVGVDCTSYDTFDLIIGPAFCTINLPFFCEVR
uniref:C-type lectin domain-containing protein n=1 Tax=Biomphalaria glabrata TaxID=6526 RepID=A0A2C9M567_BIOGL